jgi:hypothetical protein
MAACGIWTIATTGRASRWLDVAPLAALLGAAAMGVLTIVGDLAAMAVLSLRLADFPGILHQLVLGAAIAASVASILVAGHASWSCMAALKARTAPD